MAASRALNKAEVARSRRKSEPYYTLTGLKNRRRMDHVWQRLIAGKKGRGEQRS